MAYDRHTWVNNGLPALCDTTLNEMEVGILDAHTALQSPQYVARVSANFTDNEDQQQFSTIQAAIDFMWTEYDGVQGITIFLYPGVYTEQIHSHAGYYIHGIGRNVPTNEPRPVTIYNTGADADHYPLRGNDGDVYIIENVNIKTDADGVYGKISNSRFSECRFENGEFIEGTEVANIYETFVDCSFYNSKAFNLTGAAPAYRYLVFEHCWFGYYKNPVFASTHATENLVVDMDGGHLAYTNLTIGGDWYHFAKNYHSFGNTRHEYDTTKSIVYRGVTITNGMHFSQDPLSFKMVNCLMEDGAESPIPDDEADITADVTITDVIFQQNAMHNGLAGEIHITDPIKNVGGSAPNKYFNLTEAIKSVHNADIIMLQEDQTDIGKITMPASGKVQIRGRSLYGITFTGDIVDLEADDVLIFDNCSTITGGTVNVNGNNAELHLHGCICGDNTMEIKATSGTGAWVHIRDSTINGPTGKSALQINSTDPSYRITYSKLIGATGQPAIEYTVDADATLKAKFSSFLHGDNASNIPITNTSGSKTQFSVYMCSLNATWNSAHFTNLIGSAGNVVDSGIDY